VATTLAAGLVIRMVIVAPPSSADEAAAAYDAQARAVGIDATATNESFPLGFVFEGVGPESNVHQTSFGQGDATSSFPYTGDVIPGVPGLLAGVFGIPVPAYPFTVSTNSGQKPADVAYPGVSLHAESGAASTVASAVVGSVASGATSLARIDQAEDGSVTSTADIQYSLLKLAQSVTLQGVQSHADVTADAVTGKVTRNSSLTIGHISVPGLSITIPRSSPGQIPVPVPIPGFPTPPPVAVPPVPFAMGGETVSAPDLGFQNGAFTITLPFAGKTQTYALPADAVFQAFRAAGFEMTFQAPQNTAAGIIAPVFTLRYAVPAPPENQYFSGTLPITYTLGGTFAQADLHPIGFGGAAGGTVAGPSVSGAADPADAAALPSTDLSGVDNLTVGQPPVLSGDDSPMTSEFQLAQSSTGATGGGALFGADLATLYLILFALAVAAFAAVTALRLLGVALPWSF
jgi:hypothetical protein